MSLEASSEDLHNLPSDINFQIAADHPGDLENIPGHPSAFLPGLESFAEKFNKIIVRVTKRPHDEFLIGNKMALGALAAGAATAAIVIAAVAIKRRHQHPKIDR